MRWLGRCPLDRDHGRDHGGTLAVTIAREVTRISPRNVHGSSPALFPELFGVHIDACVLSLAPFFTPLAWIVVALRALL